MSQLQEQMTQAALTRLSGRVPQDIAAKAGISYDSASQVFHVPFLGQTLTVSYPGYTTTPTLPFWAEMVVLHYLAQADGAVLTGQSIPFAQMAGGLARGGGIDRQWEQAIPKANWDEAGLDALCRKLGGKPVASRADAAYRIPFLPRFPVTLQVWFADEEFPPSGRLFADAAADHYLTIEDAVVVSDLLLEAIGIG